MARLVIELTNRCNLRCQHCYDERHAATGELPLAIIETVLREGQGLRHRPPGLHRRRADPASPVCRDRAGRAAPPAITFSFVSNGATLPQIYPLLCARLVPASGG